MSEGKCLSDGVKFQVVHTHNLHWPKVAIPTRRFRLFFAADTESATVDELSAFIEAALDAGMVYFSASFIS